MRLLDRHLTNLGRIDIVALDQVLFGVEGMDIDHRLVPIYITAEAFVVSVAVALAVLPSVITELTVLAQLPRRTCTVTSPYLHSSLACHGGSLILEDVWTLFLHQALPSEVL